MTITPFWYRRICEVSAFIALIIVALFSVNYFGIETTSADSLSLPLTIPTLTGIFASITAAVSLVAYFVTPRKYVYHVALSVYLLLAITTGSLVIGTGIVTSPFIALWMLITVFGGLFGLIGLLPLAFAINVYLAFDVALIGVLDSRQAFLTFLLGYELPLVASYLIWHSKSTHESEKDKAYSALEEELSQVANKSEIVINAIADGVIAVDGKGVIQLINPAAQKIIGWGKQDAVGLDYRSVLKLLNTHNQSLDEATHPVQQVLRTGQSYVTNDLTLQTNSGKKLMVSVMSSPVGPVGAGAIIVFRDITKVKEEERQQFEFISTASHEMRTPVASIEGYLGLALNPATATVDAKAQSYLIKAQEAAKHLGRLFQDLLDVTKADDGRLRSNPSVVNILEFTQEIAHLFTGMAKQKGLVLLFKPSTEHTEDRKLSPVYYSEVDNNYLREVLYNLTENAIKYTKQGNVTIDVTGDDEQVTISIHDTGIGIPAEDIPHLFQKFYRVDNSDTREIGGTGLGLYLCRRLVEGMQGKISVKSEYGNGSTFYVSLPRLSHEDAMHKIEMAAEEKARIIKDHPVANTPGQITSAQPGPTPVAQPSAPIPATIPQPEQPPAQPAQPNQAGITLPLQNERNIMPPPRL